MSDSKKKRKAVSSEGRAIIAGVFNFLQDEYKFMKTYNFDNCDLSPLVNVKKRTAQATGVSEGTVSRILLETKNLQSSSIKYRAPIKDRRKREYKFDFENFDTSVVRLAIQNYHTEHAENLTVIKLHTVLKKKMAFDGSLITLRSLLKKMGYEWKRINNKRCVLHEKHELQLARFKYLEKVSQCRAEGRPIVYTDETYLLISKTLQDPKIWLKKEDSSFMNSRKPVYRYLIVHAGSKDGFVPNALLVYEMSARTGDHKRSMSSVNYNKWLEEKLLPNLPENALIVMDNAPCHNSRTCKIPSPSSKKSEIMKWLTDNGISYDENLKKVELLDLIKKNKDSFIALRIDEIVKSKGFEILRLPRVHSELNCIENVWSILKDKVTANNIDQKEKSIPDVITECLNEIDSDVWRNICDQVEKLEKEYMKYYDSDMEFFINVDTSDSDTDEFKDIDTSDDQETYYNSALDEIEIKKEFIG